MDSPPFRIEGIEEAIKSVNSTAYEPGKLLVKTTVATSVVS